VIDTQVRDVRAAIEGIKDGATVMVGGFGGSGFPTALVEALVEARCRDLTIISNNAGEAVKGLAALFGAGLVRKIVCSYPRSTTDSAFRELYLQGAVTLELVPQGTLAERIRAGGAGIGAFYTPTGLGTTLAAGKEVRRIDGRDYLLEMPLRADMAFIRADRADRWGNLTYRKTGRNFGPEMAMAAAVTVAEVREMVELGALEPEAVVTPGIFVDRVVKTH
jgi:3-oxoadipate CoA-transferase alpha subunit